MCTLFLFKFCYKHCIFVFAKNTCRNTLRSRRVLQRSFMFDLVKDMCDTELSGSPEGNFLEWNNLKPSHISCESLSFLGHLLTKEESFRIPNSIWFGFIWSPFLTGSRLQSLPLSYTSFHRYCSSSQSQISISECQILLNKDYPQCQCHPLSQASVLLALICFFSLSYNFSDAFK